MFFLSADPACDYCSGETERGVTILFMMLFVIWQIFHHMFCCVVLQIEFGVLLKWLSTTMKYSSYKEEFVLICELLVQAAKGDQIKTAQFYNLINGGSK